MGASSVLFDVLKVKQLIATNYHIKNIKLFTIIFFKMRRDLDYKIVKL